MKFIIKTIILLAVLLAPLPMAFSEEPFSLDGLHIEGYEGAEIFLDMLKGERDDTQWTRVSMSPSSFGVSGEILSPGRLYPGVPSVTLRVRSGHRIVTGIYRLKWRAVIAFAAKDLDRGDILSPDDISLREDLYRRSYGNIFSKLTTLVGKRITRRLDMGEPISGRDIETVMMVERGDRLTIISRFGSVETRLPGIALESGSRGSIIKVKVGKYRKNLYAVVLNHDTVLAKE